MITSFKILKFFSVCLPEVRRSQTKKIDVLNIETVGLIEKRLSFPGKILVCGWNLPYLKVNGIYK